MKKAVFVLILLVLAGVVSAAVALEDGVYRDKAPGYGGDVILTVVIRDGQIQSLVTENTGGEKSEYYLLAEETLSEAILNANGLEGVDAVAGATGTSESIIAAMQGILEQTAYTGPASSIQTPTLTPEPKATV